MTELAQIDLVWAPRNRRNTRELNSILWTVFREVEAFWNYKGTRAEFRQFHLSTSRTRRAQTSAHSENFSEQVNIQIPVSLWENARGTFSHTYNSRALLHLIRDQLPDAHSSMQVIVIDQELTPPPNWRYIIWENHVISVRPLDPQYWNIEDPNRIAIIKHRVRTTCMSIVGEVLGLRRCDNDSCFLFNNVDSATRLDGMVKLGSEHQWQLLENRGFMVLSQYPYEQQPVTLDPSQARAFYERSL